MSERKKVLWLVSWYPNKYDPFDGDFIQRHAKAAALYDDITVLFVKQSFDQATREKTENRQGSLTEHIIYLPKKKGRTGKMGNSWSWWTICNQEAASLINAIKPAVIHVHIPWKAGLVALWLKRKYHLPFVVTEHWGIYNNVVTDNIHTRPVLFRRLLACIFKEANGFHTVSRFLGDSVSRTLITKMYTVIPNVVNTTLFFPSAAKASRFTFLHVSNMVPLKNVAGILTAFQQYLAETGSGAQLVFVGNKDQQYTQLAKSMGLLDQSIFFLGEIPYYEVAIQMRWAHVLVLNSDMENSPCVIGEALCSGLPVIATNVGGIPELVSPGNSLLVPPRIVGALSAAFRRIEKDYSQFDPEKIATAAQETFSMQAVGKRLHGLYREYKQ